MNKRRKKKLLKELLKHGKLESVQIGIYPLANIELKGVELTGTWHYKRENNK